MINKEDLNSFYQNFEKMTKEEKLSSLYRLYDFFDFFDYEKSKGWTVTQYNQYLQKHIDLLIKETDQDLINALTRNISKGFVNADQPEKVKLSELTSSLKNRTNDDYTRRVIYILSHTADSKYLDVVKSYLNHPSEDVRLSANDALKYLGF